jgi:hypothetical protein
MQDGFLDGLFLGFGLPSGDDAQQSVMIDITYGVEHLKLLMK